MQGHTYTGSHAKTGSNTDADKARAGCHGGTNLQGL